MNEPVICLVGNLAGEPELKYLPSGVAVCNFVVAATPRVKNGDNWVDGETMWVRCAVWRQMAEHTAESLVKGARVIAQGRLKVRSYEKDGVKRTSLELDVDAVGPDLRYATASVKKADRASESSGGSAPTEDPWASVPPPTEEPPF